MSDDNTKIYRSTKRKRNIMAKHLRDSGDHKGAFALKVEDARKEPYRREHIRIDNIEKYFEDE